MSAVLVLALIAMLGFSGASLVALFGKKEASGSGRSISAAVAAGILLALAFADLFPEGLEMAGTGAIGGFVAGFVLLSLAETLSRDADGLSGDGAVGGAPLWPLLLGLAVHNLADGFVLGVAAGSSAAVSGILGLGILIHQVPVGLSLAAILVAARATRTTVVRAALFLGIAIPLAAVLTMALPVPDEGSLGLLTGAAGGVLAYMGAAHLLPEAQTGGAARLSGILFVGTLVVTALGLTTVLGH